MLYTIYYKRPTYNQHRTYHNNQDRYVGSRMARDMESVYKIIEEIKAKGYTVTDVYNGIGKKVEV